MLQLDRIGVEAARRNVKRGLALVEEFALTGDIALLEEPLRDNTLALDWAEGLNLEVDP